MAKNGCNNEILEKSNDAAASPGINVPGLERGKGETIKEGLASACAAWEQKPNPGAKALLDQIGQVEITQDRAWAPAGAPGYNVDIAKNVTKNTDGSTLTTDGYGDVSQKTYKAEYHGQPVERTRTFTHDDHGKLTESADANGNTYKLTDGKWHEFNYKKEEVRTVKDVSVDAKGTLTVERFTGALSPNYVTGTETELPNGVVVKPGIKTDGTIGTQIDLPNGKSWKFHEDGIAGAISQVTEPNGAVWKKNDPAKPYEKYVPDPSDKSHLIKTSEKTDDRFYYDKSGDVTRLHRDGTKDVMKTDGSVVKHGS